MLEIVSHVNPRIDARVDVRISHRASAGTSLFDGFPCEVDVEQLKLAFDAAFEVERFTIFRPFKSSRNQIEIIRGKHRRGPAFCRRKPYLRMIAFVKFAGEGDGLSVW